MNNSRKSANLQMYKMSQHKIFFELRKQEDFA